MNELNFTPKMIITIMWQQGMMMNRYTSTFVSLCLLCTWAVMKYLGIDFGWHTLAQYKTWIIISVLFIHFIPVNYLCTKRTLAKEFKGFRLVAAPTDES